MAPGKSTDDGFVMDVGERWYVVHDVTGHRVRRYRVPGGWLYQVESNPPIETRAYWHPPVFVPETSKKETSEPCAAHILRR